jgi:hypothetical protein
MHLRSSPRVFPRNTGLRRHRLSSSPFGSDAVRSISQIWIASVRRQSLELVLSPDWKFVSYVIIGVVIGVVGELSYPYSPVNKGSGGSG